MERKKTGWLKRLGICIIMLSLVLFPGSPIVAFADDEKPAAAAPGGVGAVTDEAGAGAGAAGPGAAAGMSTATMLGIGAGIAALVGVGALALGGGGGGGSNGTPPPTHGD